MNPKDEHLSRLSSFIITLSMMNIAEGLARYLTESRKHEVPAVLREIWNAGLSLGSRVTIPYSALLAAAIMLFGHIVLQHTRFGRYA